MMKAKIAVPANFIERHQVSSGRIVREGLPDYGVLFTTSETPSPADFEPENLLGAWIGPGGDTPFDENRFFMILGGYLWSDKDKQHRTAKVFGIAGMEIFGIEEGGTEGVDKLWDLASGEALGLKERAHGDGWTFIVGVEPEPGTEVFPKSGDPLGILIECPEIVSATAEMGDCEYSADKNALLRKVTFHARVAGPEPATWQWDLDDGVSRSGTGYPPAELVHHYAQNPENAPKLTVRGKHPQAPPASATVDFNAYTDCPTCPTITNLTAETEIVDDHTMRVRFRAVLEGDQPDACEWTWGDSSPMEKTTTVEASHDYTRPVGRDKMVSVALSVAGPDGCHNARKIDVKVVARPQTPPPPPPEPQPKICLWLQLIAAFFTSLATALFAVFLGTAFYGTAQSVSWVGILLAIGVVLAVVAILLWISFGKKSGCPSIAACEWGGLTGIALLAGTIDAFYIRACCGGAWWIAIVLFAAGAIYLTYRWIRGCAGSALIIVLNLLASLIAALVVQYDIARELFENCL